MKLFEIKTANANIIKILIDGIKDILTESTFVIGSDGIRVTDLNNKQIVMVKLFLDRDQFEEYNFTEETDVSVETITFNQILKRANSGDLLTLSMDDSNRSQLTIRIDNCKNGSTSTSRMKLSDLDTSVYDIKQVDYSSVITLPSTSFQQICRDMKHASQIVITKVDNELQFQCDFEGSSTEVTFNVNSSNSGENDESKLRYLKNDKPAEIYRGVFLIEPLLSFTKFTGLCNFVELYFKNNCPLIVKYSVASLGTISLCLAQKM